MEPHACNDELSASPLKNLSTRTRRTDRSSVMTLFFRKFIDASGTNLKYSWRLMAIVIERSFCSECATRERPAFHVPTPTRQVYKDWSEMTLKLKTSLIGTDMKPKRERDRKAQVAYYLTAVGAHRLKPYIVWPKKIWATRRRRNRRCSYVEKLLFSVLGIYFCYSVSKKFNALVE